MSDSSNLVFMEKEDVPFVLDKASFKLFRMDGKDPSAWVKVSSDRADHIELNSSLISREEAEALAQELAES